MLGFKTPGRTHGAQRKARENELEIFEPIRAAPVRSEHARRFQQPAALARRPHGSDTGATGVLLWTPLSLPAAMPVSDHLREKLRSVPHRPGVYLMKDRLGSVIYVGKARDLRKRLSQYFHPSRRMGWDLKFRALVETIHDFDVHVVRSEAEALLLEGKLIKEFKPRYNVSFRDDKRFLMVKVNLRDPLPRFSFTRVRANDGSLYFGPFPSSTALRQVMDLARRQFHLRGCRAYHPTEADYRHCLYAHLKHCTAPCVGNVTPEQYRQQVLAACAFLQGQCRETETQLEAAMREAAARQEYEQAAHLRDLLTALRETTRKQERFERVPYSLPVAVNPERDLAALAEVLRLPNPPECIDGFDISNISGTLKVASVVRFRQGRPDRGQYRRLQIKSVEGQDDFACIAEAVRRRYRRLLQELKPDEGAQTPDPRVPSSSPASLPTTLTPQSEEGLKPVPAELQRLIHETHMALHQGRRTVSPPGSARLPDLILIDGGKGQLNAAQKELDQLGLGHIPVIGLAKEFEEIYLPGQSTPVRLDADHPALKLLQRIRDESHRVANAYNAQLRLRRISESVLDEFPGIGQVRKAVLLKHFGSLHRLRRATVEEIAQVPGFGPRLATELRKFLDARMPGTDSTGCPTAAS